MKKNQPERPELPPKSEEPTPKSKQGGSIKKPSVKAVAIRDGGAIIMVKDARQKRSLSPCPLEKQPKWLGHGEKNTASQIQKKLDVTVVNMDKDKAEKELAKKLKNTSPEQCVVACRAFYRAGDLLEKPCQVWYVLLLAMVARVLDLVMSVLPGVPMVWVSKVSNVPQSLGLLLSMVNGKKDRWGKHWDFMRPSVLNGVKAIGTLSLSSSPVDYVGGNLRIDGKEKRFWIPLQNIAVAVSANMPRTVITALFSDWPLSIPIFCGGTYKNKERPRYEWDGEAFLSVDPQVMKELEGQVDLICAELSCYFYWLREKKGRWGDCLEDAKNYIPRIRRGRFEQTIENPETVCWAVGLSLLKSFLTFAVVKTQWLTYEEAQSTFMEVWKMVLPDSYPDKSQKQEKVKAPTAETFTQFLSLYMQKNQALVSLPGQSVTKETIAAVREIGGTEYLIFPRTLTFQAYLQDNPEVYFNTNQSYWETAFQRFLMDQGLPFRTEGKDISWRYTFYSQDDVPEGMSAKLPCLGISGDTLAWLKSFFGFEFGAIGEGKFPSPPARSEKDVNMRENAEI